MLTVPRLATTLKGSSLAAPSRLSRSSSQGKSEGGRRRGCGWQTSLCQSAAIRYNKLPTKETFNVKKVPRPVSPTPNGQGPAAGSAAADHQRHVEEVHFLLRRLQAMSILSPLNKPKNSAGEDLHWTTLELGESLDVDDVADALAAVEDDKIAKELLGFVAPPEPLKKVN